jgi:arylsulfatase A-like enzyme
MRFTVLLTLICLLVSIGKVGAAEADTGIETSAKDARPNLILIVADDLGLGDIGAFGSEIETPNLDALAAEGARLTAFHSMPSCSPTRSVLLTGVDNHLNGMGTMAEDRMPHHEGLSGYLGHLNNEVVTVSTLLQDAGYHTYMSGKWHLGFEQNLTPHARGFEHSFALLNGTANHFSDDGPNALHPKATYSRDGVRIPRPAGYSSDLFTDQLLQLIRADQDSGKPFFAYLSFTAPHWPLQAPAKAIEKTLQRYSAGWDVIRQQRFGRMQEMNLVPARMDLSPRLQDVPPWNSLTEDERRYEAKKMAVYAAMVETLDANVGKLIQYLKDAGQYENSVIMFMSDNGTDPYDRSEREIYQRFFAENDYDNSYKNMGAGNSYVFSGPGWAQTGSVHQRYYKFLPTQGGTHGPFIARVPGMLTAGKTLEAFASVADMAPTFLDFAGVAHPGTRYGERSIHAPRGRSMLPYFRGEAERVYALDEPVAFELFGHAAVFMGPWKAVRLRAPWGDGQWSLYNIAEDPAERNDLSVPNAAMLTKLTAAYSNYRTANNVIEEPDDVTAYPAQPKYLQSDRR